MEEYESEVICPLALDPVESDLDDGVKANYAPFGVALKGLDVTKEDSGWRP